MFKSKNQLVPMVAGSRLEPRLVLSASMTQATLVRPMGAPTDPSIPFVFAPPGVSQASINFTTLRASQILHGYTNSHGYQSGINNAFSVFNRKGNINRLNADLARLSLQIPFGGTDLLPTWQDDISGLSFVNRDFTHQVQQQVSQDYTNYLKDNIGVTFNYLRSAGTRNEFNIATNGNVRG